MSRKRPYENDAELVTATATRCRSQGSGITRIGLLGCGAIGSWVVKALEEAPMAQYLQIAAVLVKRERVASDDGSGVGTGGTTARHSYLVTTSADAFFAADWDVCVECAGQEAVRLYGERCLHAARRLLVTSIGALTDDALYDKLQAAAVKGGTQLMLASGAMPAVDWMQSCALGSKGTDGAPTRAKFVQLKPPGSWIGTPAADKFNLADLPPGRTVLFEGTAREAASAYPRNSNVSAMLALLGDLTPQHAPQKP
eukprot:gnl/TRDRNA2_/TRDRNA2_87090_c0_seq2.p1 gnl/TRDRNA2_/TRDRNA2_87090_c0~~gnl/TRDRNA2_/TRDRNA2_87090_c0_seq2.p1  ORF type:complete len:255 (-),score=26.80 gnl/TRDRNA2_/TRDRNA2_87090_c0_seq2:1-765(-)